MRTERHGRNIIKFEYVTIVLSRKSSWRRLYRRTKVLSGSNEASAYKPICSRSLKLILEIPEQGSFFISIKERAKQFARWRMSKMLCDLRYSNYEISVEDNDAIRRERSIRLSPTCFIRPTSFYMKWFAIVV